MSLKFIAILNQEIEMNKLLNALAHMAFGMGHRIQGEPVVQVLFGSQESVRSFRRATKALHAKSPETTIISDFPHTMVGMSTDDLLKTVSETPESAVTYFGVCYAAEEIHPSLATIQPLFQLKDYAILNSKTRSDILPVREPLPNHVTPSPMKINLLINKAHPLSERLNDTVINSLKLGQTVPYEEQRLLTIKGVNDEAYDGLTNISFHSLIITVADKKDYPKIATAINASSALINKSHNGATMVYGKQADVDAAIPKQLTRLYPNTLLKPEERMPTTGLCMDIQPPASQYSSSSSHFLKSPHTPQPSTDDGAQALAAGVTTLKL